jgi:hypothetical protein
VVEDSWICFVVGFLLAAILNREAGFQQAGKQEGMLYGQQQVI